ncbi:MAG: histidine kinase dimerization/phosphoacceptor domain -containing protein, partial [Candidatus Sericytochromatia bacterium]
MIVQLFSFISTKKLAEIDFYREILEIITPRISTELDRLKLEYTLEEKREEFIKSINLVSLERHKYKLFFDSNPQPMWVYDIETLRFISVNKSAIQHYGYSEEDFLSMTIKDIRPKEDINKLEENISNIKQGIDFAGQWRHIKKNGELIFVEITSYVIEVDNRKCELVLVNDVTSTKITESKIIELNNLMNNVIGNIDANFFAIDKEYKYISFNKKHAKGMLEIYGSNIELGKTLFDYQTNPIDVEKAKINIDRALNGESFTVSDYSGNENFSRPIFEISHNPIIDHNGEVIGVSIFAWDITEKRKQEEELKEISQRLLIATKASGVGVWEYDFIKSKFICDDNIQKIYEIPPNEINTLEDWFKLINKDDIKNVKSELYSNKDNFEYEFRLTDSNNKIKVIQGYAIVERNEKGKNTKLIGTNKDITEIKNYQDLLEKTLREKEILLKEVHHRVKNNFQIIISMLNLQKSKIKNPEALESIMDAKRRVRGIALIHQKIYQSEDLATIDFDNYISTIVNELNKTHKNILNVPVKID